MENTTVHEPAVSAEVRAQEFVTPPSESVDASSESTLVAMLEARMRDHPMVFLAGGFVAGVVLGIFLRR